MNFGGSIFQWIFFPFEAFGTKESDVLVPLERQSDDDCQVHALDLLSRGPFENRIFCKLQQTNGMHSTYTMYLHYLLGVQWDRLGLLSMSQSIL